MAIKGKISRRSFLSRVAGAAVTTGAFATVTGLARAQQNPPENQEPYFDTDETDEARIWSGLTDRDFGEASDIAQYGRGTFTGRSDEDSSQTEIGGEGDVPGYAERVRTHLTDHDSGAKADSAGYGRQRRTGVSDADSNTPINTADRAGFGGQPPELCSDIDSAPATDSIGAGRYCENPLEPGEFGGTTPGERSNERPGRRR
jgi:hypothetical protein